MTNNADTTDTITDEQIRELRDSATGQDARSLYIRSECAIALHSYGKRFKRALRRQAEARAKCAEIINARNGGK